MRAIRSVRILGPLAVLLLAVCPTPAAEVQSLSRGWQYRWGDSPREADGTFSWLRGTDGSPWHDISYPSNPPGRAGRLNVWFRTRLPASSSRDPALFVYSIDLGAELYVGGRLVYSRGLIDGSGKTVFRGWPWHLVELPLDAAGQELYVRVASDYRDIGLWGTILVGSKSELLAGLYERDAPRVVVAAASLLMGLVLLALFLVQRPQDPMPLLLSLTIFALVIRVLARTHVKQLYLDAPLLWVYLGHASTFLIAIFVTLVIEQIVGKAYRRVTRITWMVLLGMLVASMVLSLTGIAGIQNSTLVYDLAIVTLVVLLFVLALLAALSGNQEARLLCASFGVIAALMVYSILVSNGIVAWTDEVDYLIVFVFCLGLCLLFGRRIYAMRRSVQEYAAALAIRTEQLGNANAELERKVRERTLELELANRRLVDEKKTLQIVSITDSLTGMHNRMYALDRLRLAISHAHRYAEKLSIVMLDLDHFKDVNDTWGHQAGDTVLRQVAEVFKIALRDTDLAGRYGGEEFLIVLPKADTREALFVAERIRARVEELKIRAGETWLTVSGGIAEYTGQSDENLLHEADLSLYRAKEAGRNRIDVAGPAAPPG
jgi:diguanylate cyclase (GGDEF)-like protein